MPIATMASGGIRKRIVVGLSGASGAAIGIRVVELLTQALKAEVHLVVTRSAELTIAHEVDLQALARLCAITVRHPVEDVGSAIASGSFATDGMIVAPCSIHTLSGIAASHSDNLLLRAADVHLKERRRLVLAVRESPLHLGHIKLMATASRLGAIIAPPVPAFYLRPQTVADIVEQCARRIVDALDLRPEKLAAAWSGVNPNCKPEQKIGP